MSTWSNFINQHFKSLENSNTDKRINMNQYDEWKKQALFDNLRDVRYGQSFCNAFAIHDNLLFYTMDQNTADEYIKLNYVEQ
jgi:hypothetical protein